MVSGDGRFPVVDMEAPVVGWAADFPAGFVLADHRHPAAQLLFAASGVMTVATDAGWWVVPPQRAVWVPAGMRHSVRMSGTVQVRTLYFAPGVVPGAPPAPRVVSVSPLLRELVLRVVAFVQPYPPEGPEARLVAVLADEIRAAAVAPLSLATPRDPRLRAVTAALAADPADRRTLAAWTRTAGASARTLARLFKRETGVGFARWRQQACLLRALELLAAGEPVTSVALDLGYDSPSAFITMFRTSLGTTPARYFAEAAAPPARVTPATAGPGSSRPARACGAPRTRPRPRPRPPSR